MRDPAQDIRPPVEPAMDRLAEALMQRKYGQPMQDFAQTARADPWWMAQPALSGLDEPSGGQPAGFAPAIPPPHADTPQGGDVNFDDLIPAVQAGAPQVGAVDFDDLIPKQGAPWPPSSSGAGAVYFGDTGSNVGTLPPWNEDGGTVIGPIKLDDPAAAGSLNAAFGAAGSPFTPTFHGHPVTPEAGVLMPNGTVAPAWAVLGEDGSAEADFIPVAASRMSPDNSPLDQLGDWLGHQFGGWFGGGPDPHPSAPNPAPHAPAIPPQVSRPPAAAPPTAVRRVG